MKLKNILLVVNDIERSKRFYSEIFSMKVITDFGKNVILTEGLVLQQQDVWEEGTGKSVSFGGHNAELYFEASDMEGFLEKVNDSSFEIEFLNKEEGLVRLYDPDRHIIEIKEKERF